MTHFAAHAHQGPVPPAAPTTREAHPHEWPGPLYPLGNYGTGHTLAFSGALLPQHLGQSQGYNPVATPRPAPKEKES